MNIIRTIDLWIKQHDNHYECFNEAFVDGFENDRIPFDKIVKNCNCEILVDNKEININNNKHNAIVFCKNNVPIRLIVINKNTDVNKCFNVALSQRFNNLILKDYYDKNNINSKLIDMHEKPIFKDTDNLKIETDVGSCDRYEFIPNIFIKYD